jgi:glucose/arabinose dehydrogenase
MSGKIYVFNHDGSRTLYSEGFYMPAGLAFRPGTKELYVASRSWPPEVNPNEGKVTVIGADGLHRDIVTGLPCCYTPIMHQPNGIAFGSDGMVYLGIGALADHGEIPGQIGLQATRHPFEAGILRFNPDGSGLKLYASGLRNPYDLAFDGDGRLFATDNGPDVGGPEWLYEIKEGGQYAYPYYDNCEICPDPPADATISPPLTTFIPHGAIAGITAYTSDAFPSDYFNNLFVALWSAFPGAQKVVRVETSKANTPVITSDFVLGLAAPVDVTLSADGALLVADWATGHIYRVFYNR